MTNEKETKGCMIRFEKETLETLENKKAQYKAEWLGKKATKNINSLLVNRAVNLFYSDNALEEIATITGLNPKKIDISEWIAKNWKHFRINPSIDEEDIYNIRFDGEVDFDILMKVIRDSEGIVYQIELIKDNSLYIAGVELVWKIEDLAELTDYFI